MRVSTTDIQNSFGKYLKLAQNEEVVITKNGKEFARLVSYQTTDDRSLTVNESSPSYCPKGIRMTYEAYLQLSAESENRYEYIDGELYLLASPLYPHQKAVREIFLQFGTWFQGMKCEPLVAPFDITLYRLKKEEKVNVVQPDILVICDQDKIDDQGRYKGTPALVVEVLSDSTKSKDLIKKLDLYQESGISEYWVVNPFMKEIYIYHFTDNVIDDFRTFKGEEKAQSITFPGLAVECAKL